MLGLLLWSALARAGLSEAELAQEVIDLQASTRMRLLLGAVGPEPEDVLQRIVKTNDSLDVVIVRLPTAGDPARELWRALNNSGLTCALRVEPGPGRTWEASQFGNCTPQAAAAVAALPSPAEPAPEPAPEDAAPDPVVPSAPSAVILAEDVADRYVAERLAVTAGPRPPDAWTIRTGEGDALSAPTFASIVGDRDTTAAMLQEQQRALTASTGLRIGGGVVAAAALAPLINMPGTGAAREDRVWTSLFLLSTGLFTVVVAPRTIDAVNERQARPDNYYPRSQADELVAAYNETLQRDLGLIQAAPPPVEPTEAEPAPEPAPEDTP